MRHPDLIKFLQDFVDQAADWNDQLRPPGGSQLVALIDRADLILSAIRGTCPKCGRHNILNRTPYLPAVYYVGRQPQPAIPATKECGDCRHVFTVPATAEPAEESTHG